MTRAEQTLPASILATDFARGLDPFEQAAQLQQGDALILRHYELEACDREALACELRKVCSQYQARLLIAEDHHLALRIRADGVHLPRWSLIRRLGGSIKAKPDWLVTASVHNERELRSALKADADAVIVSPVFETDSHVGAAALGIVKTARLLREETPPAYVMGGIRKNNQQRINGLPIAGIAGTRLD